MYVAVRVPRSTSAAVSGSVTPPVTRFPSERVAVSTRTHLSAGTPAPRFFMNRAPGARRTEFPGGGGGGSARTHLAGGPPGALFFQEGGAGGGGFGDRTVLEGPRRVRRQQPLHPPERRGVVVPAPAADGARGPAVGHLHRR